jgi:hypothetical protein
LKVGDVIEAANGQSFAVLQPDGNFVVYGDNGYPMAATNPSSVYKTITFGKDGTITMDGQTEHLYGPDNQQYDTTGALTSLVLGSNGVLTASSKKGVLWKTLPPKIDAKYAGYVIAMPPDVAGAPTAPAVILDLLTYVNTVVTGVIDAIGVTNGSSTLTPAMITALKQDGIFSGATAGGLNFTTLTDVLNAMATGATWAKITGNVAKLSDEASSWETAESHIKATLLPQYEDANNNAIHTIMSAVDDCNDQLAIIYNYVRFETKDNSAAWLAQEKNISSSLHTLVTEVQSEATSLAGYYSAATLPTGPKKPGQSGSGGTGSGGTGSGGTGSGGTGSGGTGSGTGSGGTGSGGTGSGGTGSGTGSGGTSSDSTSGIQATVTKLQSEVTTLQSEVAQSTGNAAATTTGNTAAGSTSGLDATAGLGSTTTGSGFDPTTLLMLGGIALDGVASVGMPLIAPMIQQFLSGNSGHPGGGGSPTAPANQQAAPGQKGPQGAPGPSSPTPAPAPGPAATAPAGAAAPPAGSHVGSDGKGGFTFPDKTNVPKVSPVASTALDREVHNPNGSDATAAYAGTPGADTQAHPWSQISGAQVQPGDVVEWESRKALVVPTETGLKYLDDGQLVTLDPQNPHGDGHGGYGAFKGFFHPTGTDASQPTPAGDGTPPPQS